MLSEKEKMLRGLAHQPNSDELVSMRLRAKELLHDFNILTRPSNKEEKVRLILQLFFTEEFCREDNIADQ